MYIADIEEAVSEIAGNPLDGQEFPYQLMAAYGAPSAVITRTRNARSQSDVQGATMWRRKMHAAVCAPGTVEATLSALESSKATAKHKPRYILATDGSVLSARDMKLDDTEHCEFHELGDRFTFLIAMAGYSRYREAEENPVDVKASARLSKVHDALIVADPEWGDIARRHDLNMFMTRLIFCMFAEDTGIFEEKLFERTLNDMGGHYGEEIQRVLSALFLAMNTKDAERGGQPGWATKFPYVNGGLFSGSLDVPKFNREAHRHLVEAAKLNWRFINPDIFGSMIQVIVDPKQRHEAGMHYTSVPNILKALDPLFLNDLRAEVERKPLADKSKEKRRLQAILHRLSKIRVFDPACGSGNFLIIAYREMRHIEMRVLERLRDLTGEAPGIWSHVELGNFYGIEINDFAAETAKLSLWVAKYQQDKLHEAAFGRASPPLPMQDVGRISTDNALRVDWLDVCPLPMKKAGDVTFDLADVGPAHDAQEVPDNEVETYIVGNPPYLGRAKQTEEQKATLEGVLSEDIRSWKSLDLVSGWFMKAVQYIATFPNVESALVTTNSICQGQHVALLWPVLLEKGVEIGFAHTSFKWTNNASKNAGVTCVIVDLRRPSNAPKMLLDFEGFKQDASNITPYLTVGENVFVGQASRPIDKKLPRMRFGNMPLDGGNLIFSEIEKSNILANYPQSKTLFRELYGSQEFIQGKPRYCAWIPDKQSLKLAKSIKPIAKRVRQTCEWRSDAKRDAGTQKHADRPHEFREMHSPNEHLLIIPSVSSERREFLPVGYLDNDQVVSNLAFALYDAPIWCLSVLASRLHILWIEAVCGKLETRLRYSNTLGWHTFPVPHLTKASKATLTKCAENILVARARLGGTLAELYDPDKMPAELREAHRVNDEALEALYTRSTFRSDADRLNHLFKRYVRMIAKENGEAIKPDPELDFESTGA